ncbi:MAG: hypothetical protein SGPRY_004975 [Prymnesium sp.]
MAVLLARSIPQLLSESVEEGIEAITLVNRSGLLLGCAGDHQRASALGAIVSTLWQSHEKCEGAGGLACLLVEYSTVPFGLLKAKTAALRDLLQPPLSQFTT